MLSRKYYEYNVAIQELAPNGSSMDAHIDQVGWIISYCMPKF